MAHILLTWELGSGLGHLNRLAPLATRLRARGHRLSVALCELAQVTKYFPDCDWFQAPLAQSIPELILEPANLAEVLYNRGAAEPERVSAVAQAWRALITLLKPQLMVMDHSPLALLASQGLDLQRVTLGTGFASPPLLQVLPEMRPWGGYPERLAHNEAQVRQGLSTYLESIGQAPLSCFAELFQRVEATLLTSYPALDHFPQRQGGDYVGIWEPLAGEIPRWPDADGPRVFAYLKPFPGLPLVLKGLATKPWCSLVYCPHPQARQYSGGRLHISDKPLHLEQIAHQCQAALIPAGHGTTARLLLAGLPLVLVPLQAEQYQLAGRVEASGAGLRVDVNRPETILPALERVLAEPSFASAAQDFAQQHGGLNDTERLDRVVARLESLLS